MLHKEKIYMNTIGSSKFSGNRFSSQKNIVAYDQLQKKKYAHGSKTTNSNFFKNDQMKNLMDDDKTKAQSKESSLIGRGEQIMLQQNLGNRNNYGAYSNNSRYQPRNMRNLMINKRAALQEDQQKGLPRLPAWSLHNFQTQPHQSQMQIDNPQEIMVSSPDIMLLSKIENSDESPRPQINQDLVESINFQ